MKVKENLGKKAIGLVAAIAILAGGSMTALGASQYKSPAEAVAALTGRDVQSVQQERIETGKTYGNIAKDAGKLEDFKQERLTQRTDRLSENVASGKMTQEEADTAIQNMKARMANCDGSGQGGNGAGRQDGSGQGGNGAGRQDGSGQGGNGAGLQDGSGQGGNGAGVCDGSGQGAGQGNGGGRGAGSGSGGGRGVRDGSCGR